MCTVLSGTSQFSLTYFNCVNCLSIIYGHDINKNGFGMEVVLLLPRNNLRQTSDHSRRLVKELNHVGMEKNRSAGKTHSTNNKNQLGASDIKWFMF